MNAADVVGSLALALAAAGLGFAAGNSFAPPKEISDLRFNLSEMIASRNQAIAELAQKNEEIVTQRNQISILERGQVELDGLQQDLASVLDENERLLGEIRRSELEVFTYERIASQNGALETRVSDSLMTIGNLEDEIRRLRQIEEEYTGVVAARDQLVASQSQLNAEVVGLQAQLISAAEALEVAEESLVNQSLLEEEVSILRLRLASIQQQFVESIGQRPDQPTGDRLERVAFNRFCILRL